MKPETTQYQISYREQSGAGPDNAVCLCGPDSLAENLAFYRRKARQINRSRGEANRVRVVAVEMGAGDE